MKKPNIIQRLKAAWFAFKSPATQPEMTGLKTKKVDNNEADQAIDAGVKLFNSLSKTTEGKAIMGFCAVVGFCAIIKKLTE